MAGYTFELASTKVTAQLNITNLLDQRYYITGQKLTQFGSGFAFDYLNRADPRKFLGSLSVSY
jgi:hypothetical protein